MIEQGTGQPTDDRTETRQGDRLQGVSYLWIGVMAVGFLVLLAAVAFFMFRIAVTGDELRREARSRRIEEREVPSRWGNIYSSDGYLLASTVLRYDVYWDTAVPTDQTYNDTKDKKNISALCDSMAKYFPTRSSAGWRRYFDAARKKKNRYLRVATDISQADRDRLLTFPIFEYYAKKTSPVRSGLIVKDYSKRINPLRGMGDRLIGYSDDNRAYVGAEGYYVLQLKGTPGVRMMQQLRGEWKPLADGNKRDPVDGKDLVLTIDASIQNIAHEALQEHLLKWNAERGCAVVMDVKTGGIKAMVNLGRIGEGQYAEVLNYAVGERSDPGSTFKLMSVLALLEEDAADTAQKVDTERGIYTIYGRHVRDYKAGGYGVISLRKAFVKSSNTGIVKTAYEAFKDHQEDFIDRLFKMQVGQKTGIDIAGEPDPYVPVPGSPKWSGISMPWVSYGYEVQLTPLQTLSLYNAVAHDGVYLQPHILEQVRQGGEVVERVAPKSRGKIASDKNIKIMQDLLRGVVEDRDGTAHRACYDPDLRLAGKTGTAQYNYGRGEPMQYMVSFAGYFPHDDPQYSLIVCIYHPQGYGISGGLIAAPVVKDIAAGIYRTTPRQVYRYKGPESGMYEQAEEAAPRPSIDETAQVMPDVKGLYPADVVPALERMGLSVRVEGGTGKITHQSLTKGSRLRSGEKVILTAR